MPILLAHPDQPMSHPYRDELKGRLTRNEAGAEDYLGCESRCVHKFGPAAGICLRQFVYWTGKEHNEEGWIYKTQSEMEQETGLTRRQQEKARKILREYGVLEEDKRGVPRKLWYRVDLEALSRVMESPHSTMNQWKRKQDHSDATKTADNGNSSSRDSITEHPDEVDSTILASEYISTGHVSEYGSNAPASEDGINGRAITESTSETTAEISSEKYSSENSTLQVASSRTSHGSTAHKDVNIGNRQKSSIDKRELNRIFPLLTTPGSEAYRAYERHGEGSLSLEDLASEVCLALTGSRERAGLYIEPVRRWVAELAIDEATADQPICAE
jgi:hypothetical protein